MAKTPPIDARFVSQDITAEIDGEQGVVQERLPFHGAGEGAILPHSLGKPATLRTLLQVAETFSEWADSRFHAHCPSLFLAAGSVTPEGMRSLLRWVSKRICLLAPPIHSSGARHPKQARVIAEGAYWAICRTLNGFLLLDEMILGQDENEEAWNQNEGVRRVSKGVWERPMTVGFRHWFLERAA